MPETIKVKPWGQDQGDFVLINKDDFNPEVHELLEPKAEEKPAGRKPKAAAEQPAT